MKNSIIVVNNIPRLFNPTVQFYFIHKLPIRRKSNCSDFSDCWEHTVRLHDHLLWPASWDSSTLIHPLRTSSSSTANFDRLRQFSPTLRRALSLSLCMLAGVCVIIFDSCFFVSWRENVCGWVVFGGKVREMAGGSRSGKALPRRRRRLTFLRWTVENRENPVLACGSLSPACSSRISAQIREYSRRATHNTGVCRSAILRCHKWRVSKQNESDRKWRSSVCPDVIIASKRRMKFWSYLSSSREGKFRREEREIHKWWYKKSLGRAREREREFRSVLTKVRKVCGGAREPKQCKRSWAREKVHE